TLECSLAHERIRGPAAELGFNHHLWLDPFDIAAPSLLARDLIERRLLRLQGMQPLPQIRRDRAGVTRADAAGIDEPAAVKIADHQRTNGLRRHGRERVASTTNSCELAH